jgi:hypothetical protein
MSEFLGAAAAALGLPEPLVRRSAEARAAETGASVEEVLQAWAGGEGLPAEASPVGSGDEAEPTDVPPEETAPDLPAPDVVPTAAPTVGGDVPPSRPSAGRRAPLPATVGPREAARLPEVVTVPTAGIRERTNSTIPKWLISVLLAAPLFALFALGGLATGDCGEATELRIDVITGEIVDCDGSEWTGSGGPGTGVDFMAIGGPIYAGAGVAGVNCAGCHGGAGQGVGNMPAMTGVMTTFGSCADQIEWVELGADGFRAQGRATYGDTQRPVSAMPGFGGALSAEQLAAVVAYERVRFGGADQEQVAVDCGFVEEDEEEELNGDDEGA